jgi:hypothetical protein
VPKAWNDWYHIVALVYGPGLRGDPRGWRTFHHREHVEGDYKNPPAKGSFQRLQARTLSLMKREPVAIEKELRGFVVLAVVEKLQRDLVEVLAAAMDGKHLHVLARFSDHKPGIWIGRAKKHASHLLRQEGLRVEEGGLWARRSGVDPIRDRGHQVNTFRYILAHADRGAAVWRFDRDGKGK